MSFFLFYIFLCYFHFFILHVLISCLSHDLSIHQLCHHESKVCKFRDSAQYAILSAPLSTHDLLVLIGINGDGTSEYVFTVKIYKRKTEEKEKNITIKSGLAGLQGDVSAACEGGGGETVVGSCLGYCGPSGSVQLPGAS